MLCFTALALNECICVYFSIIVFCAVTWQICSCCWLISSQGSSVGAMPASDGNILGEETHFSSLASDGAAVTTPSLECPFSSQTQVKAQCGPDPFMPTSEVAQPEKIFKKQISTLVTTLQPKETTKPTITKHLTASALSHTELPFCVDAKAPTFPVDAIDQMPKKGSNKTSWEPALEHDRGPQAVVVYKYLSRTASWSGSASLPRGYRRSEGSSRLSSAITARPYGTKQSRVSSLPRLCSVSLTKWSLTSKAPPSGGKILFMNKLGVILHHHWWWRHQSSRPSLFSLWRMAEMNSRENLGAFKEKPAVCTFNFTVSTLGTHMVIAGRPNGLKLVNVIGRFPVKGACICVHIVLHRFSCI